MVDFYTELQTQIVFNPHVCLRRGPRNMKISLRVQVIEGSKVLGSMKNFMLYTLYLIPADSLNSGILDPYVHINSPRPERPHSITY